MKVIVIEDEQAAKNRLKQMLSKIDNTIEIISWLEDIESSVEYFKTKPLADLVFMDIQLADGISFEIFKQTEVSIPIIFTTAYDEYALQAFKANSIDYLLKPFQQDDLKKSIEKLLNIQQNSSQKKLFTHLLDDFVQTKHVYKKRFLFKLGTQYIPVGIEEIAYFYAEEKVVFAKLFSDRKLLLDFSLDELEKDLNPSDFFRINRKIIANQQAIKNIHQHFNGKLKLIIQPIFEQETYVSREKATLFKNWMAFG